MGSKLTIKRGETDSWEWRLRDRSGPVDAKTGVQKIEVFVWSPGATSYLVSSTVAKGSTSGLVTFTPSTAAVDVPGSYRNVVRLTRTTGRIEVYPSEGANTIEIEYWPTMDTST